MKNEDSMHILLVEDNKRLAKYTEQSLKEAGYIVSVVYDGESGQRMILNTNFDLVLLDIMLPDKDGIEVCKAVRSENNITPIILITAKDTTREKVIGLDSGADDYLVKPFAMDELLARVRALLRRPDIYLDDILQVQEVTINRKSHEVTVCSRICKLTKKEFTVLEYLMRNAGTVITRESLLENCWDFAFDGFSNITDVYIKQLRKKLHDTDEKYIKTVRGVGYIFQT